MGCMLFFVLAAVLLVVGGAYLQFSGTYDVLWEIFAVDL
jgi:hypothetical protein